MILLNRIVNYGLVVPFSMLPFRVLYTISDGLFYLMYYVVGYRRKVVFENISKSFPDKTAAEHKLIARKFYAHFCDVTLESLKLFTISDAEAKRRMTYSGMEIPNRYFERGQSVIVAMGHYCNWEYTAVTIDAQIKHQTVAIYKPLTNPYFDKKMKDSREKYGLRMMHNRTVKEDFEKQKNELTATVFVIDQSPSPHSKPHWMKFLNQDTAVLVGTEKYAKDYNSPVVFLNLKKIRRGYYTVEFLDVCDKPLETGPGEITERVTRMLEREIVAQPEYWLWSHRRWKSLRLGVARK